MLNSITPFFIVDYLGATLEFYQSKLGFNVLHKGGDGHGNDFWAIIGRDRVMLMFKHVTPEVHPQPNCSRYEWAACGAYILTSDPDSGPSTFRSPAPSSRSAVRAPGSLRAEAGQGAAVIWPWRVTVAMLCPSLHLSLRCDFHSQQRRADTC